MDMDEFRCGAEECCEMADFECSCKIQNKFCFTHYNSHRLLKGCNFIDLEEIILLKKSMLMENAFNSFNSKLIALSVDELHKINAFLKGNYKLFGSEKFQIRNSSDTTENLDYIHAFAREYSIKNKDKRYFIFNAQCLLSMNEESEKNRNESNKVDTKLNQLAKDIELLKTNKKNLQVEIKKKETQLNNKQYFEKQLLYAKTLCNFKSARFEEMDINQTIEYLVQQEFQDIKRWFVEQSELYKTVKISMTDQT